MKEEKLSYEKAIKMLEEIVQNIEDGNLDIDNLTIKLKEAQKLLKFCKDKLTKVDADVQKLL